MVAKTRKKVAKKRAATKRARSTKVRGLTKRQVIEAVADRLELGKKEARETLDSIEGLVRDELKRVGQFTFGSLGKFSKKDRKARKGRNPATGATIKIPAKTVLRFRIAKALKVAVLPEEAKKEAARKRKRAKAKR